LKLDCRPKAEYSKCNVDRLPVYSAINKYPTAEILSSSTAKRAKINQFELKV
jgi:hypothetical protein